METPIGVFEAKGLEFVCGFRTLSVHGCSELASLGGPP